MFKAYHAQWLDPGASLPCIVLYCIVSIHLYSASCSAHQSVALPVRETQREESNASVRELHKSIRLCMRNPSLIWKIVCVLLFVNYDPVNVVNVDLCVGDF